MEFSLAHDDDVTELLQVCSHFVMRCYQILKDSKRMDLMPKISLLRFERFHLESSLTTKVWKLECWEG